MEEYFFFFETCLKPVLSENLHATLVMKAELSYRILEMQNRKEQTWKRGESVLYLLVHGQCSKSLNWKLLKDGKPPKTNLSVTKILQYLSPVYIDILLRNWNLKSWRLNAVGDNGIRMMANLIGRKASKAYLIATRCENQLMQKRIFAFFWKRL